MSVEVKVSSFPESVEDGTLMAWYKQEGDAVARDEKIADIETDKIVIELAAPESGVLRGVSKKVGEVVKPNEVLALIEPGEASASAPAAPVSEKAPEPAAPAPDKAPEPKSEAKSEPQPESKPAPEQSKAAPSPEESEEEGGEDWEASASRLSPAARKLALEHGIDPAHLIGTGRGGRVTKTDVIRHVEATVSASPPAPKAIVREPATEADRKAAFSGTVASAPTAASTPAPASLPSGGTGDRAERRVPMTRLRARVAQRLVEAQRTAAILTTFNEVNLQAVSDLRQRYREEFEKTHGVKLGFMSFFVKAAVEALKAWPAVNASIDGSDILYHDFFDIGIAVSSPRGLVVPVLRDADQLTFAGMEKAIRDFGQRAKDSQLGIEDLTGGTFTVTNGGVFGSMLSTPILNPPQSAILGMHTIQERPVAENGQVVIRPMMYLALSYDHRLIDGREAVSFLVTIKKLLEDPSRLLFNL